MIVDDEAAGTFRVDRRVYADPAILATERRAIFERCWLYAAHASELAEPGSFVTRTVAGRPILVVRGPDRVARAFLNTCTHRGTQLCSLTSGTAAVFKCPYHAWSFDLLGRLRGLPGKAAYAERFGLDQLDLREIRLASYRDFVFVTLDPAAGSLVDYLAGAADYLDLVADQAFDAGMEIVPGTQRYGIRANWKLLGENSVDTYHVQALHRRYIDYVMAQGVPVSKPTGHGLALGNGHSASLSTPPIAGKPVAHWGPPMPEASKAALVATQRRLVETFGTDRAHLIGQTYRQLLIFPNLIVNDTCATTIRTWDPIDHESMTVTAWALAPRGQSAEDRAASLQSFVTFFGPGGFATPDDVEILESIQRGLASTEIRWSDCSKGMHRERPAYDDELQIRAFWRRWRDLMDAA